MFHETIWKDLRYGMRTLWKSPAFTLTAVLSLALGIGANTTSFTLINSILLNPFPLSNASSLASVYTVDTKATGQASSLLPVSYLNLRDLNEKNQVFSEMAAFSSPMPLGLSKREAAVPERVFGELVTDHYFELLDLHPSAGRFFLPEENRTPGTHPVVVLGNGLWQQRFGGSPEIAGQTLRLNGIVFTVIGVAPAGFKGIDAVFGPDLWMPAMMAEQLLPAEMRNWLRDRGAMSFRVAARLKPGVSRAQADANLKTIAAALAQEYPDPNRGRTLAVRPIADAAFSPGQREQTLFGGVILMAVVGLVLLIACSNVANLLLARAAARRQEIAVRLALGAGRSRLIRQLLTENVLLALLSGVVGVLIAYQGVHFLSSLRPVEVTRNLVEPKLDWAVLAFSLIISMITGLVFGIAPAIAGSRSDVAESLKEEARTVGRSRRRISFANTLLVGQVAFSLVSLITAGLFLRSIQRAYEINPGFEPNRMALLMLNPEQAGYDHARTEQFYRDVRARTMTVPGITSLSFASNLPLWGRLSQSIVIEGQETRERSNPIMAFSNIVDLNYFATAGIPLSRGRDFTEADRQGAVPIVIVNETMAQRYWPNQDALGKRLRLSGESTYRQVVGVVKTANYQSLGEAPQPCVYLPLAQSFSNAMVLYVRTERNPTEVLNAVQRELRSIDPQVPIEDVRTGRKIIDQALWGAKFGVGLLSVFGFLSLGLASIGLYGVMAYSVNRRTREIGLRMALGAEQTGVLRLVLGQGMRLVGIGIALGLGCSLVVAQGLSRMLFGVSPVDPVSLGGASLVLAGVALLACYLPARRASRVDPLIALREG